MDLATIDHLLTTTRSVRKRLDLTRPVPSEVIDRCIEIAMQAPTASNAQHWHFVVVTDAEKRAGIAAAYRKAFAVYAAAKEGEIPASGQMARVADSAVYLAEHLHEVPVHIIGCVAGRFENQPVAAQAAAYGSILPAAWSLMLTLRARGIGSAWTTLHLVHEREVGELLGIPASVTQAVMLPVAFYTGHDFKPADRRSPSECTHWNTWGHHSPDEAIAGS